MQDGHQTCDLCKVIGWVRELGGLGHPPSQVQKIRYPNLVKSFAQNHKGVPSCRLLIWKISEDVFRDLNEKIASLQANMKAEKLNKLVSPMTAQSRRYYRFEGNPAPHPSVLPWCITELYGMRC